MFIDCFHHIADIPVGLLNVDDASVIKRVALDEGEKIVVKRHEQPVVVACVGQLPAVGVTETILPANGEDCSTPTTQSVRDRNPDTLVAVQRSHASAESGDRKLSM
ncbi:MAG: hypothetical protein J07HN6_00018 [Halonotius sp. J07HN6]|nr:MAG: hypothetical protein J07HN6_00018 [Halonotius sp. J07HN6]